MPVAAVACADVPGFRARGTGAVRTDVERARTPAPSRAPQRDVDPRIIASNARAYFRRASCLRRISSRTARAPSM
jgi:hypothetical protein